MGQLICKSPGRCSVALSMRLAHRSLAVQTVSWAKQHQVLFLRKTNETPYVMFFLFFGNISNVLGFLFFSSKNAEHSTNMSNTWFVLFKVIVWKFCHHLLTITMCQTCMTFFCGKQKKIFWRILGTTDFHYMGKSKTNKQTNKNKNNLTIYYYECRNYDRIVIFGCIVILKHTFMLYTVLDLLIGH